MSDESVDSQCSTVDPFSPLASNEEEALDEAADEAADEGQEPAPEYVGVPYEEVIDIMEIIRGWNADHGFAYTMGEVLRVYGRRLNVEHIQHDPERSARDWFNLFSEAHDRDYNFYDSGLLLFVTSFITEFIERSVD